MPDQFAKPASQLGAQIPNTARPTAGKGLALDETGRVDPGLLQQAVAANGQVLAWSTTQNKWVPTSLSGGTTPTPALPSKLYDFTITGADQASVDTNVDGAGAGLLSGSYDVLEVWVVARTDDAGAVSTATNVIVNNDTGANYDAVAITNNAGALSGGLGAAGTSWAFDAHGSGGTAGYAGIARISIPGYAATSFNKIAEITYASADGTTASDRGSCRFWGWRNTAAITRIKLSAGGAQKLKVGSRLLVYGR